MDKMTKEIQAYKGNNNPEIIRQTAWNLLSKESQKAYASDFKLFFDFVKKDVKQVNSQDIMNFIEHLQKSNYKNSSINRKMASLSKFFEVLVMSKEIEENPIKLLKQLKKISFHVNKEIRSFITMEDIRKAIKSKENSLKYDIKIAPIIKMLAKTGLRISELTNIQNRDIEDFDEKNKIIRIVGKGKKERFIFLDNIFFNQIKKIFPDNEKIKYLFYSNRNKKRYDRNFLGVYIKNFFKRKINKNVHPHMLRHVFITHKISVEKQDIKAVSRYCGHADVSTTLNMYVDHALDVKSSKIKI